MSDISPSSQGERQVNKLRLEQQRGAGSVCRVTLCLNRAFACYRLTAHETGRARKILPNLSCHHSVNAAPHNSAQRTAAGSAEDPGGAPGGPVGWHLSHSHFSQGLRTHCVPGETVSQREAPRSCGCARPRCLKMLGDGGSPHHGGWGRGPRAGGRLADVM